MGLLLSLVHFCFNHCTIIYNFCLNKQLYITNDDGSLHCAYHGQSPLDVGDSVSAVSATHTNINNRVKYRCKMKLELVKCIVQVKVSSFIWMDI